MRLQMGESEAMMCRQHDQKVILVRLSPMLHSLPWACRCHQISSLEDVSILHHSITTPRLPGMSYMACLALSAMKGSTAFAH